MSNKVLVCIINELRAHELTWNDFKKNVIDELNADLAVCVAIKNDNEYENNNFYNNAKYKWTFPEQHDWGNSFDYVKNHHKSEKNWEQLLKIGGIWLGGMKRKGAEIGSASIGYFFRWLLLQNLVNNNLINKYDYFIITRCDYKWALPHPPLKYLSKEFIWVPNGDHYGGVNDRYMCVSKDYVKIVLNLLEKIVLTPLYTYNTINKYYIHSSSFNSEKFQKIYLDMYDLFNKVRTFPYIMYLIKGKQDSSRWSKGIFEIDGYLVKYQSEYDMTQKTKSFFTNWDDYFMKNPNNLITDKNIVALKKIPVQKHMIIPPKKIPVQKPKNKPINNKVVQKKTKASHILKKYNSKNTT
jgi:hypothetical protein